MRHWEFESDDRKDRPQPNKDDDSFDDPDVKDVARYAKHHYPGSRSLQGAFYKFVQRSLLHSLEADRRHDRELNSLRRDIDDLKKTSPSLPKPEKPVQISKPEADEK